MHEEIDDSEFYHEDFTTASEWEILVAHMEEIVNQWKSDDLKENKSPDNAKGDWQIKFEKLVYIDSNFNFTWYKRIVDEDLSEGSDDKPKHPLDKWHDFNLDVSNGSNHKDICLAQWYGLDEFIVLSPASNLGITNNESKAKILLSACTVLVNNLSLETPLFIQGREKWQNLYWGVYEANGIRTNFDIVHLKRGLYYCQYLTGLLDLFKTKIMSPCTIENIFVSFQGTYVLQEFNNFVWKQDIISESMDVENLFILPFGVSIDPVSTICLKAIWNRLSEHSVIDTESYTDFDPLKAQKWHCSVSMAQEPLCLLGDCLGEFLEILKNTGTVYDILGDFAAVQLPESNPLDLLTEPSVPTISSLVNRAARTSLTRNKKANPPLQENVLVPLLYFLFPDADENASYPYDTKEEKDNLQRKCKLFQNLDDEFKGFKTCAKDSLIWRLSTILSHTLQSLGGIKAFCHVWYEFVQEMRYRWEKSLPIPGLASGMPDLGSCLLNQKLQMLNCCLARKINREAVKFASAENSEESDDEFFDATDDIDEEKRKGKYSLPDKPVGRLSKFGDMKLLSTGEPLYIPFTQDLVLKTEDQLKEDEDILLKLGSNQEASELRAKIMSPRLLSDMESFKAANPGAILEDFIRWFSPRDWIEQDELDEYGQKKGTLSARMQLKDNIWLEMWQNARPIPANRQKRLFDDTREAEKVLQFLDFRTIDQIAELLIPILSHTAICRLVDEIENLTPVPSEAESRLAALLKHGQRMSRDLKFQRFEAFVQEVTALELQVSQINSLQYKLNPQGVDDEGVNKSIGNLASGKIVNIENKEQSLIGSRIASMFTEWQRLSNFAPNDLTSAKNSNVIFPLAVQKEFVLRANCVRPSLHSAKSPQFLRAVLGKDEFRLVGAFSEDTAFF